MSRKETVSSATVLGERDTNEDRLVNELIVVRTRRFRLLGVFDGHGGAEVADTASKAAPLTLKGLLEASSKPGFVASIMHSLVADFHQMTKHLWAGSTASLVCIPQPFMKAYIAVLGDSPVIICSQDDVFVGLIHNALTNIADRDRAKSRGAEYKETSWGGYIGNGEHFVQLTRCLGDEDLDSFLVRTPEVTTVDLVSSSTVLVASDGLWNPSESREAWVGRMVGLARRGAEADAFVQDGLRRYGKDNVTAVVWRRP